MQSDSSATNVTGSAGPAVGMSSAPPWLPRLVPHMPDDAPLVLRPRASRLVAFFGALLLGVPAVVLLVFVGWMMYLAGPAHRADVLSGMWFTLVVWAFTGGIPLMLFVAFGMGNGPHLAAAPHGIWVQSRKWRTRSVFLPWEAVDRISVRRHRRVFWRLVCVDAGVPPADSELRVRLDMRRQRIVFGKRFNASPFFCGRRPQDVLAELSRLSGGRVRIG